MKFLKELNIRSNNDGVSTGLNWLKPKGEKLNSYSPVDGKLIASVTGADAKTYEAVIQKAQSAFIEWRSWPAPKRGEIVRQISEELRKYKQPLGELVSYEMVKACRKVWAKCRR